MKTPTLSKPQQPTTQKSFADLKAAAIAHLKLCPGIDLDRLLRKLGLPVAKRYRYGEARLLERSKDVITALEAEGAIRLVAPLPPHVTTRVWLAQEGR